MSTALRADREEADNGPFAVDISRQQECQSQPEASGAEENIRINFANGPLFGKVCKKKGSYLVVCGSYGI